MVEEIIVAAASCGVDAVQEQAMDLAVGFIVVAIRVPGDGPVGVRDVAGVAVVGLDLQGGDGVLVCPGVVIQAAQAKLLTQGPDDVLVGVVA